jgi:eukaryotic-like serine/threonine-protein kinase
MLQRCRPAPAGVGRAGALAASTCAVCDTGRRVTARSSSDDSNPGAATEAGSPADVLAVGATLAGVPPPPSSPRSPAPSKGVGLAPGEHVGRYVIEQHVGTGGMGEVYAAHDPQLDRRVAIKVLRPVHRAAVSAARLLREAQALARLDHPNVVAIHDVGEAEGRVFLAMQFVEGHTLGEFVTTQRPPWQDIVALYVAAGRGLAAAHAAGLIHRDFKPSNVLVDRAGVARVTDFGVARAAGDDSEVSRPLEPIGPAVPATESGLTPLTSDMTEAGAVIGTPAFMAPEQHAGQRGTARSDQFGFCASMWQSLFGRHPFVPLDHGPVGSAIEYIAFISEGVLVPPPAGHPVPRRIVAALTRGLARQPEARWSTMTALLEALDLPTSSTRTVVVGLSTVAALGVGAALWLGLTGGGARGPAARCEQQAGDRLAPAWGPVRATAIELRFRASGRPHAESAAAQVRADLDRYAVDWRAQAVAVCAAGAGPVPLDATIAPVIRNREACLANALAGLAGTAAMLADDPDPAVVDKAAAVVDGLPTLPTCAKAEVMAVREAPPTGVALQLAPLQARLARLRARLAVGKVREVAAELPGFRRDVEAVAWPPLEVGLLLLEGTVALRDLRAERAPYLAAARLATMHGLRDEAASAWARLVEVEGLRGSLDAVESYHQIAAVTAAATRDPAAVLREQIGYGRSLLLRGRGAQAQEVCTAALAEARAADLEPTLAATARDCVMECAVRAGRYAEAEATATEAMADLIARAGEDHPAIADYLGVVAWAREVQGRPEEARAAQLRSLAIRERAFGPRHVRVAESLVDLAGNEADVQVRRSQLERALAIVSDPAQASSRGPRIAIRAHTTLAELAVEAGDLAAMQRHFEEALALEAAQTGPGSLESGFLRIGYGQYLSEVDVERSLAVLREAEDILTALGDPRVAVARSARAGMLVKARRWAEALPLLERTAPALPLDGEPLNLGLVYWNLARARAATGADRAQIRTAAATARGHLVRAGESGAELLVEVDALLAKISR